MSSTDGLPLLARYKHAASAAVRARLLDDSVALPVELGGATLSVTLSELLSRLQASYCGSIALECGHVRADDQLHWLYARMETMGSASRLADADARRILEQLVATEMFE